MATSPKVSTCLWFDRDGEDAARFYASLFADGRVLRVSHYGKGAPMPEGTVLTVEFELGGARFMALNGGPQHPHTEACSIVVDCDDQAEIDRLWAALTADGGKPIMCGWLRDRWGVSWQINYGPSIAMLTAGDAAARDRVMAAIMGMVKTDVAALEAAFRGDAP